MGIKNSERLGRTLAGLFLLAALLCTGACRDAGPRVDVTLAVRLEQNALPAGGPLALTYVWQVAAHAEPMNRDYRVFAHFGGADGEQYWADDHDPPVPSSRWQPGQVVEYTRFAFIPDSAPPGEITLSAGLYDYQGSGEKVLLEHEAAGFEVLPADLLPIIIYDRGWHALQTAPGERKGPTWRWSQGEAVCWVEAPGRPCSLFLEVQAPVNILGAAQTATFELEGVELAVLELDRPDRETFRIPIPETLMLDRDCVRLLVRTDRVVPPGMTGNQEEARELGLKFHRLVIY